ncbi:MAG: hypothetical protein HFI36_02815 [Bacilli bacterium]|jgi:hypothetical protein|nr:hypothetical protein [Bacilli bacterium]
MNKYPEYIEVASKKYKINTDFRLALKCDGIFRDETIGDYEKMLAIIYILLGDSALKDTNNHEKIFKLLIKYLRRGKNFDDSDNEEEPSMDFKQDQGYIKASFMSDYNIDLDKTNLSWWGFYDLLEGLTDNSVLNRVRAIREEPLNDKKGKERARWEKLKKQVELKREKTAKEKELDDYWEKQMKMR